MDKEIIYIGRRISGSSSIQAFLQEDGQEIYFKGIRGVVIGHTYGYKGDGKISKFPERVGKDVVNNPKWDAQDALTEVHLSNERSRKRYKSYSRPAYREAVAALKPLFRGLNFYDRKALLEKMALEAV